MKYNTADSMLYPLLHQFALENKKHQTDAERFLWSYIRSGKLGYKFNRQHIIDQYIADFVCLDRKLIIEVDGGYHCQELQQEQDLQRTERLNQLGFRVIRFDNERIIADINNVLKEIKCYLNA